MMLFCYFITKYIYKFKFISIRDSVFAFKQYQNYTFFHRVFKYKAKDHFWFMDFFHDYIKEDFFQRSYYKKTPLLIPRFWNLNCLIFFAFLSDINHFPRTFHWVGSQNLHPSCCHLEMANKLKWEMPCKCSPRKKYI